MGQKNTTKTLIKSNTSYFTSARNKEYDFSKFHERYKLGREIGSGGYGVVRKCYRRNVTYAVKILYKHEDSEKAERHRKRFLQEIGMLRTITHPNVLKVFEHYEDRGHLYLIEEYLPGGDLFHMLRDVDDFTEETVQKISRVLIKTLKYCFDIYKIFHRDLKPENILLRPFGEISRDPLDPKRITRMGSITTNRKILNDQKGIKRSIFFPTDREVRDM
eukprot:maker-scaffold_3-snap-gene-14.46-mRNA-1 protein AED:0.49 eAED:0.62 QI:0/0/0/1/0/0/2/0/217